METDIGNPIEYSPELKHEDDDDDDRSVQYVHHHPQQMMYMQPPPPPPQQQPQSLDFTNLDKNTYVVMFIAFIIGFFMGKTMQPVILRTS